MQIRSLLPLAAVLMAGSSAFGTLLGINDSPLGSRSSEDVEYAVWDSWNSLAGGAGTISGAATLNSSLTQSVSSTPPFGAFGSGDLFYTSSSATDWSITANASINLATVVLQIKLTTPAEVESPLQNLTASTFFTPLLNGVPATPVVTGSGYMNSGFSFSVVQWTWENLDIAADQSFTITFSSPAGGYHTAIDTVVLDVSSSAVPEPSTWALLGFGAIGAFIYARRARRLA